METPTLSSAGGFLIKLMSKKLSVFSATPPPPPPAFPLQGASLAFLPYDSSPSLLCWEQLWAGSPQLD